MSIIIIILQLVGLFVLVGPGGAGPWWGARGPAREGGFLQNTLLPVVESSRSGGATSSLLLRFNINVVAQRRCCLGIAEEESLPVLYRRPCSDTPPPLEVVDGLMVLVSQADGQLLVCNHLVVPQDDGCLL